MASWYRKPRWIPHGSGFASAVVGDRSATSVGVPRTRSRRQKFAQRMKKNPTRAEAEFIRILNTAYGGRLRDSYTCQRCVGCNGILDVYFFEHRLGVEIDGSSHNDPRQRQKDAFLGRRPSNCNDTATGRRAVAVSSWSLAVVRWRLTRYCNRRLVRDWSNCNGTSLDDIAHD